MTRTVSGILALLVVTAFCDRPTADAAELSGGQHTLAAAAQQDQHTYLLFYRGNDAETQGMHRIVQSTAAERTDAVMLAIRIDDASEQSLIDRFDATRTPLPATVVLAPNGAITSLFPQRVTPQQLQAAIVSDAQAECLKALQEQKIVLLCAQPEGIESVPAGVQQFQADAHFASRTQVVTVQANDPAEAKFLNQLKMPTNQPTSVVAFMAPPGVMLGIYNANVTHSMLAQKLAAAGKCCDDPNCKHHQSAGGQRPASR